MKLKSSPAHALALATAILTLNASPVLADTSEHYATCKAELKAMYGEETRIELYGTKSYRGVQTLKLKVTPAGEGSLRLLCSGDAESDDRVVLKDKNGEMLVS